MKNNTKRSLIMSLLSMVLCMSMLIGTTFAWFTDTVTSSGNIIKSGTLDVSMEWADGTEAIPEDDSSDWKDASTGAIFDYELWEPGYTEVRHIKIANEGTLALKYQLKILANGEVSELADVIDVYYVDPAVQIADRSGLTENMKIGTLTQVLGSVDSTASGNLLAGEDVTITLALKMQETAGNEYQDLAIGSDFTVQLVATQLDAEEDFFDKDYDVDSSLEYTAVSNDDELRLALANQEENIVLTKDFVVKNTYNVNYNVNIDGAGHTLYRTDGIAIVDGTEIYTGAVFTVKANATLNLEDITVDGGAVWTGEVNEVLQRGTVNTGVTATGALVTTESNAIVVLGEGAVLQNNDGANAVHLNTRVGCKLIINGGEIINNSSAAGAIWGGGEIILNSGKVNNNYGGIGGAIRVVTNIGTVLTMNGGEMNHNYSAENGGAIWAGTTKSSNVYVLNGGEMAYNYSASTGGAIYAGYYETVKIGGTFKMHDNDCSANIGAAIRFHDHASLVMTGGEIYNNGDDGNSLFLNNNSASITGGKIVDNFGYSGGLGLTWGQATVDGVIAYNLGTNHNTAYLAKEFNTLKFTVNEEASNFANFNFKPAADYTYTEGDEAKLVCMNDGYETYWDATSGTFRLQAK